MNDLPAVCAIIPEINEMIRLFEGKRLKAYKCQAGVWTIGWGTTVYPNGEPVKGGDVCTLAEAMEYFTHDITRFSKAVCKLIQKIPDAENKVTHHMYGACLSLAYNIGVGGFRQSSVYRHMLSYNWEKAADAFLAWNKVRKGGVLTVSAGLSKRRKMERQFFMTPDVEQAKVLNRVVKVQAKAIGFLNRNKEWAPVNVRNLPADHTALAPIHFDFDV